MRTKTIGIAIVLAMLSAGLAHAGDVNVVNPAQPGAPAPAAPVVVPAQPTVVQPQPVVAAPGTQKVVEADVEHSHNYMGTIAVSALLGGVAGVLVGGSIYYLGDRTNARNIGFWAAGGVLVGTAVGVTQVVVEEDRTSRLVGSADPVPTYRLALARLRF
jgi:hypothetical protein